MFNPLLDMLFPQESCSLCRKSGRFGSRRPWCLECSQEMKELSATSSNCEKCGKYLDAGITLCADCRQEPPRFALARAVGPYEDKFRLAIKVLKFMGRKYLAPTMGAMMAEKVKSEPAYGNIDVIIPVPIAPNSFQTRGFNQAGLLARQISRELGIKAECGVIVRVKDTPQQKDLTREEREKNLLCAFEVREKEKILNKSVLLVDDVYTTGSTSREITRILLEAGAERVSIITWATGRGF